MGIHHPPLVGSSQPGPLNKTACRGRWFTMYHAGRFDTHTDLVQWLIHKVEISGESMETFTEDHKFVFTHQALSPRNLILDRSNRLWMIDLEFSRWYPAYFEYVCVASLLPPIPEDWISQVLQSVGEYGREYRSLQAINCQSDGGLSLHRLLDADGIGWS
jgi:Phosphotransferase enzyme family